MTSGLTDRCCSVAARRLAFGRRGEHELRLEVLVEREVEERVERIGAPALGDLGDAIGRGTARAPGVSTVSTRSTCHTNTNDRAARVGDLGAHPVAQRRVAQARSRSGVGQRRACRGSSASRRTGTSMPSEKWAPWRLRREHRMDARGRRAAASSANSRLRYQPSGACGIMRERVEVHGSAGRARHVADRARGRRRRSPSRNVRGMNSIDAAAELARAPTRARRAPRARRGSTARRARRGRRAARAATR